MEIDEKKVEEIVKQVLAGVRASYQGISTAQSAAPAASFGPSGELGIFATIDEAIDAAFMAQRRYETMGLDARKKFEQAMCEAGLMEAERLARLAIDETKIGRYEDKIAKNELNSRLTAGVESLTPEIITGSKGTLIVEYVPFGVVAAVTPVTNPTSTIINNSIMILAAGNSVVYLPHPSAKDCTLESIRVMNRALKAAGAPDNLITTCSEVSIKNVEIAFKHQKVKVVCATGGSAVVKAALSSGKKALGAGPGNPVSIVDETANIAKAAKDICFSAPFDNNLPCLCEKVVVVIDSIADELMREMTKNGAYLARGEEASRITNLVVQEGHINKNYIGKDADVILRDAGIFSNGYKLIIFESDPSHPIVEHEQMMPVLPIVRAKDYNQAKELAIRFEHGYGHTASIHSNRLDRITDFLRAINTTLFIANGPHTDGDGTGEGPMSMTLAGPTGEGLTTAKTFTRQRRVMLSGALSLK
ncbi:MAG: aldehyde dehydrogenase [Actinobacteria bacterium]|nr:aldehyde dehydrogenase [Actinomycetota bacterium]